MCSGSSAGVAPASASSCGAARPVAKELIRQILLTKFGGAVSVNAVAHGSRAEAAEVARVVLRQMFRMLCGRGAGVVLAPSDVNEKAVRVSECDAIEVSWMATGCRLCCMPGATNLRVADMKALINERTGVPAEEQQLFVDGRKLAADVLVLDSLPKAVQLVRSIPDPRETDLGHFRTSVQFTELPQGAFTEVRKLASGIHGDVFKYRYHGERFVEGVAVKKLREGSFRWAHSTETDERKVHMGTGAVEPDAEDALTDIGVLSYLSRQPDLPLYILNMLGAYDAGSHAWLVTEFAEGGELFDVAATRNTPEPQLRRYMWELLQAVAYLHRHQIGHRDISLENILLKDGTVKVMDFGMAVRSHSSSGIPLRYYRAVGKVAYRPPECHVPKVSDVKVLAPGNAVPQALAMVKTLTGHFCEVRFPKDVKPWLPCRADVWGYAAALADMFSSGVCFFTLHCRCPPWRQALLSDPSFAHIHKVGDSGVQDLMRQWKKPALSHEALQLLTAMMRTDPSKRPSAAKCLEYPWFSAMAGTPVPVHAGLGGA